MLPSFLTNYAVLCRKLQRSGDEKWPHVHQLKHRTMCIKRTFFTKASYSLSRKHFDRFDHSSYSSVLPTTTTINYNMIATKLVVGSSPSVARFSAKKTSGASRRVTVAKVCLVPWGQPMHCFQGVGDFRGRQSLWQVL